MTYGQLYNWAETTLQNKFEAGQLFTHVTGKQVFHLHFLGKKQAPDQTAGLLAALCQRRLAGEPLQYLLGEWEFYGLPFKVGKGVLIPRPDTETLVEVALEKIGPNRAEVLDLCSGTGCVAVALSHERADAAVTALELSDTAFGYLKQNIALNRSRVQAVRGDLLEYRHPRLLDLLVANPPYIPRESIASLQQEVRHEPVRALDGGVDGLDFYRAIVRLYRPQLLPGGWICMEVGIGQSGRVLDILSRQGFAESGVRQDLQGVPRVVFARKTAQEPV